MQKNKLQCGFGLLGICCSDCLQGPCRINPWEKEIQKGKCDADIDIIVINNLLKRLATGTAIYANYARQLVDQIGSQKVKLDFLSKQQFDLLSKYNVLPASADGCPNIYDVVLKAVAPASTDINELMLIGLRCALANLSLIHFIYEVKQSVETMTTRNSIPQWCEREKSKLKNQNSKFDEIQDSLIKRMKAEKILGIAFFVGCTELSSKESAILEEWSKNGVIPLMLGCQNTELSIGSCISAIRVVHFINLLSAEFGVPANMIPVIAIFCEQIDRRIEVMAHWMIALGIPVYWMKIPPIVGSTIATEFFTKTVNKWFGGHFLWEKSTAEVIKLLQDRTKSLGIKLR